MDLLTVQKFKKYRKYVPVRNEKMKKIMLMITAVHLYGTFIC
jgi:hypothetical protein